MTAWFVVARAVHIGACLLLFGVFAFDRFVRTALPRASKVGNGNPDRARVCFINLILLPIIFLSGIAWLAMVATTMSGEPLQVEIIKTVWMQTHFGKVWKVRLILWLAATVTAAGLYFAKRRHTIQRFLLWLQLLLSGALLGSLAWAGHGLEDSQWHLAADVVHLLVAGFWPAGLLPFLLLFRSVRQRTDPGLVHDSAMLVRRFSAISLASVALLTLSGLVNTWFLVGSVTNLVEQPYGRWLLLKLLFFCVAVAIGAVNLLRLKPRLTRAKFQTHASEAPAAQLELNLRLELFLGSAVVVVVAILGLLPPAMH